MHLLYVYINGQPPAVPVHMAIRNNLLGSQVSVGRLFVPASSVYKPAELVS